VGGNGVPTPFLSLTLFEVDYIKTWLRSHASDTQMRTASQKSTVETGRSSVEILVGRCASYSNYLVQSSLFGVGTAFPHLFLALHPRAEQFAFTRMN